MCTDELFQHPGPDHCYSTSSSFVLPEQRWNILILVSHEHKILIVIRLIELKNKHINRLDSNCNGHENSHLPPSASGTTCLFAVKGSNMSKFVPRFLSNGWLLFSSCLHASRRHLRWLRHCSPSTSCWQEHPQALKYGAWESGMQMKWDWNRLLNKHLPPAPFRRRSVRPTWWPLRSKQMLIMEALWHSWSPCTHTAAASACT